MLWAYFGFNSRARSIKTRIETFCNEILKIPIEYSRARSIKTRIETRGMVREGRAGNKDSRARSIKTRIETLQIVTFKYFQPYSRARSIKTRIETAHVFKDTTNPVTFASKIH